MLSTVYAVVVCLCVSVTLQYCIKTAKRRITQITPHDIPLTQVFWHQSSRRNSKGITPYGGNKWRWGGLKLDSFDDKRAITRQEALLLQRDWARHLSVEILQLQNISLENPIVWHYLRDSTFSRFDTIPECDRHTHRQTDRHTTTAYTILSIVSRGKNRPYCTAHQL